MVCFLAIFGREDCSLVGGLPVVQDPRNEGQGVVEGAARGFSGSSDQRIANEPAAGRAELAGLLEAEECDEEGKCSGLDLDSHSLIGDDVDGEEEAFREFESLKTGAVKPVDIKKIETRVTTNEPIVTALKRRSRGIEIPETEDDPPMENRQRKSLTDGALFAAHQQTTNMRPIRKQHLAQEKRSPAGEATPSGKNRRMFNGDGNGRQGLQLDLSRALYQFGPAQLHALRGVFDRVPPPTRNFKPIPAKQVAYVPPRIVYETKLVPAPFAAFGGEQKTVDALSALLGQSPDRQLEGLNLILGKDGNPQDANIGKPETSDEEISPPGVALPQSFVTPIPSADINHGLADTDFGFSNEGVDLHEERNQNSEPSLDLEQTRYPSNHQQDSQDVHFLPGTGYKTIIPIVETPGEELPPQTPPASHQEERRPVYEGGRTGEATLENSVRYPNHGDAGHRDRDHGVSWRNGQRSEDPFYFIKCLR